MSDVTRNCAPCAEWEALSWEPACGMTLPRAIHSLPWVGKTREVIFLEAKASMGLFGGRT